MEKKLLFLCTTEFQLMTALNIKAHLLPERAADIIIDNYHGEEEALAARVREVGLFEHVMYVRTQVEEGTLHKYLRDVTEGRREISLMEAVRNTLSFLRMRIGQTLRGDTAYLETMVSGFGQFDPMAYEMLFSFGWRPVVKRLIPYFRTINPACKMAKLDEGTGTYQKPEFDDVLTEYDCLYVYAPELLQYKAASVHQIPKLSPSDTAFIEQLNHVFQYHGPKNEIIKNKVIFFDDGVAADMPAYLRKMPAFLKVVLSNSYKKHVKEREDFLKQLDWTRRILQRVSGRNILIKFHPRESQDVRRMIVQEWQGKVTMIPDEKVPWELIMLNNKFEQDVFLTEMSSAAVMLNEYVDGVFARDNKIVICLRLLRGSDSGDEETRNLIQWLCRMEQRDENYHVPKTWAEFDRAVGTA